MPMYETLFVESDSILSFGRIKNGCRTYLGIYGEWQIQKWLGSAAAAAQNGLDLTPDSIILKNGSLRVKSNGDSPQVRVFPKDQIPQYLSIQKIHVLPGPEFENFSRMEIAHFFSQAHKITSDSNRMGYRLNTQFVDNQVERDIISSGVIPGTIQITNAGKAILLMKDAQTSGGYARFLNVISEDLDKLGQMKPGEEIEFVMKD